MSDFRECDLVHGCGTRPGTGVFEQFASISQFEETITADHSRIRFDGEEFASERTRIQRQ